MCTAPAITAQLNRPARVEGELKAHTSRAMLEHGWGLGLTHAPEDVHSRPIPELAVQAGRVNSYPVPRPRLI